jgi:hypothetical protein|tara:strand:+ start:153 stop:428 length:276 start_codon:yes stop_codon:yes gene_type:complete
MHKDKSYCEMKRMILGDEHPPYGGDSFIMVKKRLIADDNPLQTPDTPPELEARSVEDDLTEIVEQLRTASGTHAKQADRIEAIVRRMRTEP